MKNESEQLITSFITDKIGITPHFITDKLALNLKKHLLHLLKENLMVPAKIGNNNETSINSSVRGDRIYWLDRKHNNVSENDFLDQIEDFILLLNRSCFAGITSYEFHYSFYDIGSFYTKHYDQFKNNNSRAYSMISYLNDEWKIADGGELMVYQNYNNQKITPTQGKTVLFRSDELQHEVLVTQKPRMSITGWLKRD